MLYLPEKNEVNWPPFVHFCQRMANRIAVGSIRYGRPRKEKLYLTRLKLEVKAYVKTGNIEHLYNAANYCFLESEAPENKKAHYNDRVDSATRNSKMLERNRKV